MLRVCIAVDELMDLDLWAATLAAFPPDEVFVVAPYGGVSSALGVLKPFRGAKVVASAHGLPGDLIVFSPMRGERLPGVVNLGDVEHPDDALYFFGSDNRHLEADVVGRDDGLIVGLECDGFDHLYAHVAGAIVLHDRLVSRG